MDTRPVDIDFDHLIAAIRREAALRGDAAPFRHQAADTVLGNSAHAGGLALPANVTSIQQLMPFHGARFVMAAYRTILQRAPDPEGHARFVTALAEGRQGRWEVLARLRLSAEGRQRSVSLRGLWTAVAFSMAYRIPVVGPTLGVLARLLCLPAHLQDIAARDHLIAQILAAGR